MVRAVCHLRAHALKGGEPIFRVLRRTAPRRLSTKPFNTISTPFPTFDSVSIARFIGYIDWLCVAISEHSPSLQKSTHDFDER